MNQTNSNLRRSCQPWAALSVVAFVAFTLATPGVHAADSYWDNSGGTANDWGNVTNWSTVVGGGSTPAAIPGTSDVAIFSATSIQGTAQTLNLNANRSVQGLNVLAGVTASTTLLGGGSNRNLTNGVSGIVNAGSSPLTIGSGAANQNVNLILAGSQSITANGSGSIAIVNTVAGTGSPTLTNNGTGPNYVGMGTLQASVGKIVQDSATSDLGLRANNGLFTGNVEILKGKVKIGTSPNNLGTTSGQVILGGSGSDSAMLDVNDGQNIIYVAKPIVLGTTSGLLKIVLRDEAGGSFTHTITGPVSGNNNLTIENKAEAGNIDDKLTFTTGGLNNAGTITHIGTGSGDLTINSVIGANVTGVIQNSGTSKLVLTGNNTYGGDTSINAGTLALTGSGAIGSSANILLAGGATFNVSGRTSQFTNGNAQTLKATGTATAGTITMAAGKGVVMGATSGLQFTAYNGSQAPLTVNGTGGSLTLAGGNLVTVTTTSLLGLGSYKLIAKSGSATVAGTAPSSVTINGAGSVGANTLSISNGELYLVVSSVPTYPITYNGNGNTGGTAPADQTKVQNVTLVLASNSGNLVKTGHVFVGWNTQTNGNGTSYPAGGNYTTNAAVTLYAQWVVAPYTVTYSGNGNTSGSAPSDGNNYSANATVTVLGPGNLGKTGYAFAGWNTGANGSGTSYAPAATFSINSNTTLHAQWAPPYEPPYDSNLVVLGESFVPTKVFDAKVDFGAAGNGSTDDSVAVQNCINAARNWTNGGAIAYFPKGTYRVTTTINVSGSNYFIGGSSQIYSLIEGTVSPVMLISDPVNIRMDFIQIQHTDEMQTAIRQVSSSSGAPSRIHYDQVYINAYGTDLINASTFTGATGMAFEARDLSSNSVLTAYLINTQLKGTSFENASDARILISHIGSQGWGAFRVRGTQARRNGFLGILTGYHCYRIEDNHSLVVSDGYQEQMRPTGNPDNERIASPYLVLSGSPSFPAGRVTLSSPKCDGAGADSGSINSLSPPFETYITVDNYHGRLSHVVADYKNGSATFDPNKTAFKTVCTGTAPLDVLFMGNTYEQGPNACAPVIEGGTNVSRHLLANWNPGLQPSSNKLVATVTNANSLNLAAQALNDFRELGRYDLLLNHNINSAAFPVPTPEQAQTYPELPELNWQKRSDWLDVKALPPSVNGGQSAVGNGTNDDTAAILAACNEVRKSSSPWSTVYLPPGTYKITSTLHPTNGLSTTASTHLYMRGHGRMTKIEWHGPSDGRMFRSECNVASSFIGIVWDGRNIAAEGFIHDTSAAGRLETKVLHQHEAFLNFTQTGAGTASGKPDQRHLESSSYRNCIFINCGEGLALMQSNDYIFNVDDCQFYDNDVGVYVFQGEAFIRNCRFFRSSQFDIMNDNDAPNSSIRRCSSVGSGAFYKRRGTTVSISRDQNSTIQDCYISDWTNSGYAIQSSANGANSYDPMLIFDCTFENGPSTTPPIRLDRPVQVVHSNNKWTLGNEVRTGAQLFAGNVQNIQEIPFTPNTTPQAPPTLNVTIQGTHIQIGWTPVGGTLQSSPVLGTAAVWTPVGTNNPVLLPINDPTRFFRAVTP